MRLTIHTDGASRGNPGPAAWAALIYDCDTRQITAIGDKLGTQTNNYAEHYAMREALLYVRDQLAASEIDFVVEIRSDSKLVVNQVNCVWAVKDDALERICIESQALVEFLRELKVELTIEHVRREFNKDADALANYALDSTDETDQSILRDPVRSRGRVFRDFSVRHILPAETTRPALQST
jgi:ribonuclease HI